MDNKFLAIACCVMCVLVFITYKHKVDTKKEVNWGQNYQKAPQQFVPKREEPKEEQPKHYSAPQSYSEALSQAKATNKKVFIFFSGDDCRHCDRMKENTFGDDEVKSTLSNYIVYMTTVGKDRELAKKYNVRGVPFYCVEDANGSTVKTGRGYRTPNQFESWISSEERTRFFNRRRQRT